MRKQIFNFLVNKLNNEEKIQLLKIINSSQSEKEKYIEINNFITERNISLSDISSTELRYFLAINHSKLGINTIELTKSKKKHVQIALALGVILLFIFSYNLVFYYKEQKTKEFLTQVYTPIISNDVSLQLSNGKILEIDSHNEQSIYHDKLQINTSKNAINVSNINITANTESVINDIEKLNTLIVNGKNDYLLNLYDGSQVWLRSKSKINFPDNFTNKLRKVSIEGEAYFKIAKNTEQPFVINANGIEVIVHGTEFNVKALPHSNSIEVSINNGVVSVNDAKGKPIVLNKNEQLLMNINDKDYTLNKIDAYKYKAWKDGYFVFIGQDLTEILDILSKWYDIEIVLLSDTYNKELFNGKFSRESSLERIITTLQLSYDFNFYIESNKLYIK